MCEQCGRKMLRKTLSRHMHSKHGSDTLQCDYCTVTFKRQDHLQRHVQEQHNIHSGLVECVYCGKRIRPRYLNDHFKGQKCRSARAFASRGAAIESCASSTSSSMAFASSLLRSLGTTSVIDPLLTCANLFCWSWARGVERFNEHWFISAMLSPFQQQEGPQFIGEIWQLRGLTLHQTRQLVADTCFTSALEADYCMLCLGLLALADVSIFGPKSPEYRAHWKALEALSAARRSTQRLLPLVETLTPSTSPSSSRIILPIDDRCDIGLIVKWVEDSWAIFISEDAKHDTSEADDGINQPFFLSRLETNA